MTRNAQAERAAIYARISEDSTGHGAGVQRQLEDARALAAARGWRVVGEYADNNISALTGKVRPEYDALMAAVRAGEIDRIVVYMQSRLWRNRGERAAAIDLLARHHVSVSPVRGPELDMSSAMSRGIAGILGEFDTMESEVKSERVKRAAEQRRAQGRANGPALYGWRRRVVTDDQGRVVSRHDEVDPDQASIVQEIVRRLLDGDTLGNIARDLEHRKVPTPYASQTSRKRASGSGDYSWIASSVRKLALRPANIGLLTHNRKPAGRAEWQPIVSESDHYAVTALLDSPGRRTSFVQHERRHLLTFGIGECGICGSRLRVAPKSGHPLYVCDTPKGCVGRRQEWVDGLVHEVVIARLEQSDAADLLAPRDGSAASLRDALAHADTLRDRLSAAADMFADGGITADQLRVITEKVEPDLANAEATVRRLSRPRDNTPIPVKGLTGRNARRVWSGLDVNQQRAVLETLGLRVRILPTRPGPGFRPQDVEVLWSEIPQEVAS